MVLIPKVLAVLRVSLWVDWVVLLAWFEASALVAFLLEKSEVSLMVVEVVFVVSFKVTERELEVSSRV